MDSGTGSSKNFVVKYGIYILLFILAVVALGLSIGAFTTKCDKNKFEAFGVTCTWPTPKNEYWNGSECEACGDGKRPDASTANFFNKHTPSSCEDCPAGTHGTGGTCTQCNANDYSAKKSTTISACKGCGTGQRGDGDSCKACGKGYQVPKAGDEYGKCTKCPIGHYSTGDANETCTPCAAGEGGNGLTGQTSAATAGCSLCPAGTNSVNGMCTPCKVNHYSAGFGNSDCQPCGSGLTTNGQTGASECYNPLDNCMSPKNSCHFRGDVATAPGPGGGNIPESCGKKHGAAYPGSGWPGSGCFCKNYGGAKQGMCYQNAMDGATGDWGINTDLTDYDGNPCCYTTERGSNSKQVPT